MWEEAGGMEAGGMEVGEMVDGGWENIRKE